MRIWPQFIIALVGLVLIDPCNAELEIEACERALSSLVEKLEVDGKLSSDNVHEGSPLESTLYALCAPQPSNIRGADVNPYLVYRHPDDVTIFIVKTDPLTNEHTMFGPFFSAYRK